jgi:hypothetical protein
MLTMASKRAEIVEKAKVAFLKQQFDDRLAEEFGDDDILSETTSEVVGNASQYFTELGAEERDLLDWLRTWSIRASSYTELFQMLLAVSLACTILIENDLR